jgi:hypothetical protein
MKFKKMKPVFLYGIICCLFVVFASCKNVPSSPNVDDKKDLIPITSQTFKTADGWGYNIMVDNKLFIKQATIPVVEGNKSFATEQDAEKVGTLVLNKIKQHQKPSVQKTELQALGIID